MPAFFERYETLGLSLRFSTGGTTIIFQATNNKQRILSLCLSGFYTGPAPH